MPRLFLNQNPQTPEERLFARQIEKMLQDFPAPLDGPTAYAEGIRAMAENLDIAISSFRSGTRVLIYRCLVSDKGNIIESDPLAIIYG